MKIDVSKLKEVTSASLFLDKSYMKIDPGGILSETIFGPINNFRCSCGNLNSKSLHAGQLCPKCNVLCCSSEVRYTTFGKIDLIFPVVKKQKQEMLIKILKKKHKKIIDPIQADLNSSTHSYMKYISDCDDIKLVSVYDEDCIPLAITGLFSLYICFYTLSELYGSALANEIITKAFTSTLLVTPPDTRSSLVAENKGNTVLYKSDIDDLYINILNIQKYNKENYGDIINVDIYLEMVKISIESGSMIPIIDDQLKLLDGISSYFQFFNNKIYDSISTALSGKNGLIRRDFLGKTIDFSSRAVVNCDPSLLAYQVRIPKTSFIRLFYLEYSRFLKVEKGYIVDKLRILIKRSEVEAESHLDFVDEFIEYFFKTAKQKERLLILNRVPSLN